MSDLTATVIGANGRMGQEHVAAYRACGVELIDFDVAGNDGCNIVSIASPDRTHAGYVTESLEGGCHVFCEKPLYTSFSHGFAVKRCLDKHNKHLVQNFPLRHVDYFKSLKREDFGEIYRIDAAYNWGRTEKLYEGWRKEDPNYSLVMGGLIHMVDLILWLTGLNMEIISAIGVNKSAPDFPNYDTVMAQCRLSNGGICNLTIDGGSGILQHSHSLRIVGTIFFERIS